MRGYERLLKWTQYNHSTTPRTGDLDCTISREWLLYWQIQILNVVIDRFNQSSVKYLARTIVISCTFRRISDFRGVDQHRFISAMRSSFALFAFYLITRTTSFASEADLCDEGLARSPMIVSFQELASPSHGNVASWRCFWHNTSRKSCFCEREISVTIPWSE